MDKLFRTLALDFPDIADLVDEVRDCAQVTLDDAPAFEEVLSYQDPAGPRLSAFSYEAEWTALPSLRTTQPFEVSAYRVTPYIGLLQLGDLRFAALSDSAFALPAGNPAGGEHRLETMDIAAVGLDISLGDKTAVAEFSLRAPSTEEFYRTYKPRWVTPHARIEGIISEVTPRHVELTGQDFNYCTIDSAFGPLALALPGDSKPKAGQAISGEAIMVASSRSWPPNY